MKLYVCESCEAEFSVKHHMDDIYYIVSYCLFCGEELSEEFEDEIEEWDDENEWAAAPALPNFCASSTIDDSYNGRVWRINPSMF